MSDTRTGPKKILWAMIFMTLLGWLVATIGCGNGRGRLPDDESAVETVVSDAGDKPDQPTARPDTALVQDVPGLEHSEDAAATDAPPPEQPARPWCGNGICEAANNETPTLCPQDCKGPRCGDDRCDANETPQSCPLDCKEAAQCGDGKCEGGETATSCPQDCSTGTDCGNGTCDPGETNQSCPKDCPAAPVCGDGKCEGNETATSCPKDCQTGPVCGNGTCETGETSQSCPKDCPPTSAIWAPPPGTTWQWQLSGKLDTSFKVQMYDIDLFDNSAAAIASLKAKGIVVICYFSAGSYEKWRPDEKSFPQAARGSKMDGWDELWLDIRHQGIYDVMRLRIALAKQKGCDGVEPDNVDGYQNKTGFPLKASDQLKFNRFLASEAHKLGLSIGLKNDLDQIKDLVKDFDFAVNEECAKYNECNMLTPFITAGKAVFHVEYPPQTRSSVCAKVKSLRLSTLIKKLDLGPWQETCP